jgi:hypothetical protein
MNKKYLIKILLVVLTLSSTMVSCCKALDPVYKMVKNAGFIPYVEPISDGATGILIGGEPAQLDMMSTPKECFPDSFVYPDPGEDFGKTIVLRPTPQNANLPTETTTTTTSGNNSIAVLNILKGATGGSGALNAGASFNTVKSVSLEMDDVTIEILDSIAVTKYYESSVRHNSDTNPPPGLMDTTCQQYLNVVGYTDQVLRFGSLKFTYTNKSGAQIKLNTDNIKNFIDLNLNDQFTTDDEGSLISKTPMYIGYQLGSLRGVDQGYSLYRASTVDIFGRFVFASLNNVPTNLPPNNGTVPPPSQPHSGKLSNRPLDNDKDDIAKHSVGMPAVAHH